VRKYALGLSLPLKIATIILAIFLLFSMAGFFILPFDHRGSFKKLILGQTGDITPEEAEKIKYYKHLVFDGFKKVAEKRGVADLAILVDEEFGMAIHNEAKAMGVRNLVSTEKSGQKVFDFEYENWQDHLLEIRPTYAKALIRIVKGEDYSLQNARLRELHDFCSSNGIGFLIEPLIEPSEADLALVGGDKKRFDAELRPERFAEAIRDLHEAKIFPDVWKIEGTETREGMEICSKAAFDGGKEDVQLIILGRGESPEKVEHWLTVSAKVRGVTGFAVGRTIFAGAVTDHLQKKITEEEAVQKIADLFEHFIEVFTKAQK
jgi:myo-inositol catabolism protein IolC